MYRAETSIISTCFWRSKGASSGQKMWGAHGRARSYNRSVGSQPPAGFRGRDPCQGSGAEPPGAANLPALGCPMEQQIRLILRINWRVKKLQTWPALYPPAPFKNSSNLHRSREQLVKSGADISGRNKDLENAGEPSGNWCLGQSTGDAAVGSGGIASGKIWRLYMQNHAI